MRRPGIIFLFAWVTAMVAQEVPASAFEIKVRAPRIPTPPAVRLMENLGKTLEQAAQDTGKALERAGQDTGKTLEKAAQDTGKTLEKAGQDTGKALKARPKRAKTPPPYKIAIKNPNCPTYPSSKVSWNAYLANSGLAGVQFRYAKDIRPDDRAAGTIDPAACYSVRYTKGNGYSSDRVYGYERQGTPQYDRKNNPNLRNLPGNPTTSEVNVYGVRLRFNKAGEILDLRGRRVGILVCYLSNECNRFGY